MHSIIHWKLAKSPNYDSNVDKEFPYSEVPYVGGYKLIKIPKEGLIELVDYWGEGLINAEEGVSGFADCYNVNHEYQLVSNGRDRDSKIPNRISVVNYTNCNTSGYIKDNSVKVVTLMGAPINNSCAEDIARIVNEEVGKVIIYGFDDDDVNVKNLTEALSKKGLLFCHEFAVTEYFKGPNLFKNQHKVFLNVKDITEELYNSVTGGLYDRAIKIAKTLNKAGVGSTVADTVDKMLKVAIKNVVGFAQKLSTNEETYIIQNYFPEAFNIIARGEKFKLINKGKLLPIKIDEDFDVIADEKSEANENWYWKAIPEWNKENDITFKIQNLGHNMFLTLSNVTEENGDRIALGTLQSDKDDVNWTIEPLKVDDDLFFFIVNKKYKQGLKLNNERNETQVSGHNGPVYGNNDSMGWFIAPIG